MCHLPSSSVGTLAGCALWRSVGTSRQPIQAVGVWSHIPSSLYSKMVQGASQLSYVQPLCGGSCASTTAYAADGNCASPPPSENHSPTQQDRPKTSHCKPRPRHPHTPHIRGYSTAQHRRGWETTRRAPGWRHPQVESTTNRRNRTPWSRTLLDQVIPYHREVWL